MFKPTATQFATIIEIRHRVVADINGASEISYPALDPPFIVACAWKSMGGSENTASGSLVVEDTAKLEMWFDPNIGQQDAIYQVEAMTTWQMQYDSLLDKYTAEITASGAESEAALVLQEQINAQLDARPIYEIINIENVEMRNQFMILKVKRCTNA